MNSYEFRDPTRFIFNQYINQTAMHPIAIVILVVVVLILMTAPRRYWFISIAVLICMTGPAQRIVVAGIDFNMLRLCGILGVGIALLRGEFKRFSWNSLDTLVLCAALVNPLFAAARGQVGAIQANIGMGMDAMSMYLLGRLAIQGLDDVYFFAKSLVILAVPLATFLVIEKSTGRNFFSVMGGIPEFTQIRDGKLRAQGAFVHPIIAGCWFAASLPLVAVLLKRSKSNGFPQWLGVGGMVLLTASVIATASSTPLAAAAAGIGALCIFPFRAWIRPAVQIGFLLAIIVHFVSASGFHHLLYTRIVVVSGSTGHFRYRLVDAAINQFGNWFLIGQNSTYSWGWGLDDVTHEFVLASVRGGLIGLVLLIAILVVAFRRAGTLVRSSSSELRWVGYCLGVSVFTHVVSFNGTSYFGQVIFIYYFTLGALQTLAEKEGVLSNAVRGLPLSGRRLRSTARRATVEAV